MKNLFLKVLWGIRNGLMVYMARSSPSLWPQVKIEIQKPCPGVKR